MLNNSIPLFVLDFFFNLFEERVLIKQTEVLTEKNLDPSTSVFLCVLEVLY